MEPATDQERPPVLDYPGAESDRALPHDVQLMLSPPTWSILVAVLSLLVMVWSGRLPGSMMTWRILSAVFLVLGCGGYWLLRFIVMLILMAVYRLDVQQYQYWKRWAITPLIVIFSIVTLWSDWPANLVFALHRPHMEQLAEQFLTGEMPLPVSGQRIGLYDFDQITIQDNNRVSFRATVGAWGYSFQYRRHATNGNIHPRWKVYSWD